MYKKLNEVSNYGIFDIINKYRIENTNSNRIWRSYKASQTYDQLIKLSTCKNISFEDLKDIIFDNDENIEYYVQYYSICGDVSKDYIEIIRINNFVERIICTKCIEKLYKKVKLLKNETT